MKKLLAAALAAFFVACTPAAAQWQTPNHSVPVGRGIGITGFKSVVPGTSGYFLGSTGASSDPTFQGFLQGGTGGVTRSWQNELREVRVSPQQFSSGTGLDSASIQKALDYVNSLGGGTVYVNKCGTYTLTSTLTVYSHTQLIGGGFNCTIFSRSTDYGDTLVAGDAAGVGAQAVAIKGILFTNAGTWTGTPKHIRINSGQDVIIQDNWIWGLYDQVYIDGGFQVHLIGNTFSAAGTVGNSSIKVVKGSVGGAIPTDIVISQNYIAGGSYAYGVYASTFEKVDISNNYMGGYDTSSVYISPITIASGLTINGNFFDPANIGSTINFVYGSTYAIEATIYGNNFYGGFGPAHHIFADLNGANPSVINLNVTGNTFRDSKGSPIKLQGAIGFVVSSNQFLNYNYANTSLVDPEYASGVYILCSGSGVSRNGTVSNNIFGANDYTTPGNALNYAVWGIYTAGTCISANVNLIGNEGVVRTGGAIVSSEIGAQKTLTSSADKMIPRASGTTGNLQSSSVTISDTNDVTLPGSATLKLSGSSSGTVTQAAQAAAGSAVVTWGTSSGTPVVGLGSNDTNVTLSLNTTTGVLTPGWTSTLANSRLATMATNTVKGNATSGTASPTDLAMTSCSAATTSALIWTTNTGFGCRTDFTTNATAAVGQLPGTTTNDNASAGKVGEFVSSTVASGSAISLTNAVPANLTSISLTAGDWDVGCFGYFTNGASTVVFYQNISIGTTSATQNNVPGAIATLSAPAAGVTFNTTLPNSLMIAPYRMSLSATTTVYCVGIASFTTSTETIYGLLQARRAR